MNLTRHKLEAAITQGILNPDQAEQFWQFLSVEQEEVADFRFAHILYYLGGLIAIGAMTVFMNLGWERFGGTGLLAIALAYATAGIALTEFFMRRKHLVIPAGITSAFVVALVPLAVYGLQSTLGYWAEGRAYRDYHIYIDWRWIIMELSTLAVGIIMLWRYRLPFAVMPVAVTLWYMSMDLTPFLFSDADYSWEIRKLVSLWFGLIMIMLAFWVDIRARRSTKDFAFWLYFFGVLAFWGGLSMMTSDSEWNKFLYCCINVVMILVGALLSRRVFVIFGGLGISGYLFHLANDLFKDSMLFPFALTITGLGIIGFGILWQRYEASTTQYLRALLPVTLKELFEKT